VLQRISNGVTITIHQNKWDHREEKCEANQIVETRPSRCVEFGEAPNMEDEMQRSEV